MGKRVLSSSIAQETNSGCVIPDEVVLKRISDKSDEKALLEAFNRGEASAIDRLFCTYAGYLSGVGARYVDDEDLKDVLQESFIKIFTHLHSFHYKGEGSLRAWMTRIVVNEALLTLRRRKASPEVLFDKEPPEVADEAPDTEGLTPETLVKLIRKLPEGYRQVLNLFAIEGKSHKEIGQLLGIKPDSSASQFHRAKSMLARLIKEYKKGLEYGRQMD